MQQKTADLRKISLFLPICDEYPIVYDIIWIPSFNTDIQQQLREFTSFIEKLSHLAKCSNDPAIRKVCSGILWNLQQNHKDFRCKMVKKDEKFDIMISYSHTDKQLCRQLYDELVQQRFRVWIDFAKHEFTKAMDMLAIELCIDQTKPVVVVRETHPILEWTKEEMQEWLVRNGLLQMSRLLPEYEGRSLLYFHRYMRRNGEKQETIVLTCDAMKETIESE